VTCRLLATTLQIRNRIIYGVTDPTEALGQPRYPSKVQKQRREVNATAIAEYL
jgi:hypothetical protein